MTNKDYILIADAIKAAKIDDKSKLRLIGELGMRLSDQNPKFNYLTFKEACGAGNLGSQNGDFPPINKGE